MVPVWKTLELLWGFFQMIGISSISAIGNYKTIFVTSQKHPDTEDPGLTDIFEHGTVSSILQIIKMPNGSLKILVEGIHRAKITELVPQVDFLLADF